MKIRKAVCIGAVLLLAGGLAACGKVEESTGFLNTGDKIKIAIIGDEEYIADNGAMEAMEMASKDFYEKTGVEKKDVVLVTTSNDSESNLEEETDGSVETNTEVSESGQVEEVSGTSQAPTYNNRWNISLTDEEIDLLAKIVWLEANGEPVEGQEAVVEVVLNRMASDLYPDTLYDVLSQNNPVQFVSWKRRDKAHPTETEYQSIYNVLNGNTDLLRNDTMNFSTYPLTSNLDVKICCHYFCY